MPIRTYNSYLLLILTLAVSVSLASDLIDAAPDDYEPPFPSLVIGQYKLIRIVSETSSSENGYRTDEEYVDFERGRLAHVVNTKEGRDVMFLDAADGLVYNYKPYTCKTSKVDQFQPDRLGLLDLNNNIELAIDGKLVSFKAFGVAGIWLYASTRPKVFSNSDLIYSASQEMTFKAFTWTVKVPALKLTIILHFLQKATHLELGTPILSPEIIQVVSTDTEKPVMTFNIISVDESIDDDVYEELMSPPIGYGCFKSLAEAPKGRPEDLGFLKDIHRESSQLNMELVATNLLPNSSSLSADGQRLTSDVMNVEIAYTVGEFEDTLGDKLYLFRTKSSKVDTKSVYNLKYNVRYDIDSRRGTCIMSHLSDKDHPRTEVRFQNDLKLDLSFPIQTILFNSGDFIYMRTSSGGHNDNSAELYWFERTVDELAHRKGPFRLVRKYIKAGDVLDLQSVVIWRLSEDQRQILETYQINLAEVRFLTKQWPDQAKVFDISQECYLNNPEMMSGRDYAWLEVTYPASERLLDALSSHELELKRLFHENLVKGRLDVMRVPRLELMTENEAFVVRYLLLDIPSLEFIYDVQSDVSIMRSSDGQTKGTPSTSDHYTTDLGHCAHLCRLNYCTKMSFCPDVHWCIISLNRSTPVDINPYHHCNTYQLADGKPGATFELHEFLSNTLHSVIARYQHQDYHMGSLPVQPDEILEPPADSGLSPDEYRLARDDYLERLAKFLEEDGARVPDLTLAATIGDHFMILLPSKFEIENDPLASFGGQVAAHAASSQTGNHTNDDDDSAGYSPIIVSAELDQRLTTSFHVGLLMYRYKPAAIQPTNEFNMKTYSALSYEQCALICLDAKCGSFSYCQKHQDCTISSINNTGVARSLHLVEIDPDCSIIERDFLSNFVKFEQTLFPEVFRDMASVRDASECALRCVSETNYTCLSFDYCVISRPEDRGNICLYQADRFGTTRSVAGFKEVARNTRTAPVASQKADQMATCDHYSRSFLADFNRIESRRIGDDFMGKLKTTELAGSTVFDCAERCANEFIDCTAFQFCYEPKWWLFSDTPELQCTLIESKLPADTADETDGNNNESMGHHGLVVEESDNLVHDSNCQLFALRRDSSQAQLRELALGASIDSVGGDSLSQTDATNRTGGLWTLYLVISVVAACLWCSFCLVKDNNQLVRERIERGRILLGISPT